MDISCWTISSRLVRIVIEESLIIEDFLTSQTEIGTTGFGSVPFCAYDINNGLLN